MRIEIICTGDEVLTGKIINTNFSYMAQKLEDFGLSVAWGTIVGDDREELLAAFRLSAGRADAVIVNGGLGPTVDDLSQEIAARAAGVDLVLNEDWLQRMEDFFRRRNRVMSANNRKQAMLLVTAEILDNPIGTACGFALDIGKARFFFTPGVPRELRRMLEEQIVPRLLARGGAPAEPRQRRVPALLRRGQPRMGSNDRKPVTIILTAIAASSRPNKRLKTFRPLWPMRSPIGWAKRRMAQTVRQVAKTQKITAAT